MQAQIDMVEQMKTRHDMPLFRGQSSRKIIPIMFLDIVEKRACTKKSQNQTGGLVITFMSPSRNILLFFFGFFVVRLFPLLIRLSLKIRA